MTSQRKLFFAGYIVALGSLAALAPLGGCGGDDSGAAGDSGVDSPFEALPDSATHRDGTSTADTGVSPGSDGAIEAAAADTSMPAVDAGDSGVPTDPIALWHFDEGSGAVAYDSSGHLHTATLMNGATFAPGKHGTGLSPNASGWAVVPAPAPEVDSGTGSTDAGGSIDASDSGVETSDAGVSDSAVADAETSDGAADANDDAGDADAGSADADLDSGSDAGVDSGEADAGEVDSGEDSAAADAGLTFAPLAFDTTKSFSIACWVKVYSKGAGQWESAFSRSGQNLSVFTLKLRGDSPTPDAGEDFDFDFPGADNTGTGTYTVAQAPTSPALSTADGNTTNWYHLVGVLNVQPASAGGTTVGIYVNGAVQSQVSPGAAPILEAVGDTLIGASLFNTVGASWNGVIDEVYLFDRALSAGEVAALYDATK